MCSCHRIELLDAAVHRVRYVQAATAVEEDSVRKVELSGPRPLTAESAQVLPRFNSEPVRLLSWEN
jgi:hypothetical protein